MRNKRVQAWRAVFASVLLIVILTACNLTAPSSSNGPDVIYVTATFGPEDNGVQVVEATPVPPTPTPEPTIEPGVALQQGDRDLLNGRFENAVFMYQSVLAQGDSVAPDQRAAAAYGMGQAALREGLFDEAVSSLSLLINQFPQDARIAWAFFLRGDANLGLSRWNDAIADYQEYLKLRPGLIDSYVSERIGDAQLALGQYDAALASYAQATSANRSLVPQLALREKVAQVYISAGRIQEAVAQYDAILAVAQNDPYRASIELDAGQALLNSGDKENGLPRIMRVFDQYPTTASAYQAMNILLANNVDLDNLAAGKVAYNYGDYQTAIDDFNRYTTEYQSAAIPAQLYLLLGRAYREIGNSQAAQVAFQTIIDQYPQDPLFGEALLEQGRTYFLAGDNASAIARYIAIADTYSYLPQAAEALWRAGYLYATGGDNQSARTVLTRLADNYPDTEQARSGLFIAASGAYNDGLPAVAENLYARLSVTTTGDDQAAAYLWVARLAMGRGDMTTANSALDLAVKSAPDSYYAARAGDIHSGAQPFQPPTQYVFQFDDVAQLADAENWLRTTFGIQQEGALWPLSDAIESDPRLIRGRELWAVSNYTEAEEEFEDLLDEKRAANDALAAYQLAIYLRGIGAYKDSIIAAADVIKEANVATLAAPPYIARMRYPAYYLDIVLDVSQRRGVDPLLLFSLIRNESLFDTTATGGAGEKGLTQVIPGTADYIAGQINWPDYQHSDLLRPYAGIEFGAYYLQEQLTTMDGNVMAALAGYNAGPGRALSWLSLSGGDPDQFMTNITIDSTRTYVQRLYGYYNIYRALYGQ